MDDKDDDKKRVLTPPSEWSEGMKPTFSPEAEEINESTDWLEDDDFEVPPESERANDREHATDEEQAAVEQPTAYKNPPESETSQTAQLPTPGADVILTDHADAQSGKTSSASKLPWFVAIAGFVVAGGMGGLWLDSQETAKAEIAELRDTIRSIKRSENKQSDQDSGLVADNEALKRQIAVLQRQNTDLADENEALKRREAEQTQRATLASTNTISATEVQASVITAHATSSSRQTSSGPQTAPPKQTGGLWFVNLESHKSRAVADERLESLGAKLPVTQLSIASANVNGQTYYRVRAADYASKNDATAASKWLAQTLNAGPFWLGKDRKNIRQAPTTNASTVDQEGANQPLATTSKPPVKETAVKKPVRLRSLPMRDNWFVFVDTYDSDQRADEVISALKDQGLDAKVAVESRSGELFYRVQIVGIESEATGNTIVAQLKADEFKNARLRKTVN